MKTQVRYPVIVMAVFIWIGFVGAISFMEAWLKFQAPGITLGLGLGIGRLVFNALNKVEWVLAIITILTLLLTPGKTQFSKHLILLLPLVTLIIQTVWLLPALDVRAALHIKGQSVPPSNNHFYYVGGEIIKVITLITYGISLFKKKRLNEVSLT